MSRLSFARPYSDCSWDEMLRHLGHSDRLVILKKPFDHIEVLQLANSLTPEMAIIAGVENQNG